jgi:hypothetical protein
MPKTYNPRVARPKNVNRFRGVTSALVQSSVPDELSVTQHNVESREIRSLSTRRGLSRKETLCDEPLGAFQVPCGETYDGSIYARLYGHELEALAEGTRVWASFLFPFASGPASNFDFTPEFPTFLPPDFPDGPDYDFPTVELPDTPDFVWPGIDPFQPTGPYSPPPSYPYDDGNDPPDAPYGPFEPPGFGPAPTTPCDWEPDTIQTKFRMDVTVDNWKIVQRTDSWESVVACINNWCEPSVLDCPNYVQAKVDAVAWAAKFLEFLKTRDGRDIIAAVPGESSADCTSLDWTLVSTGATQQSDFSLSPAICVVPEFPTGTPQAPNGVKWEDWTRDYKVYIDVTLIGYKPLALATNFCKIPKIQLEWQNGYKKVVPLGSSASTEINGDDLKITDWDIGTIDSLKTNTGYPTFLPCDLVEPNEVFLVCEQQAMIWDCNGAPPPPINFNT